MYLPNLFNYKQGVTQGQFLNRVKLVIHNFPSPRQPVLPKLNNRACPTTDCLNIHGTHLTANNSIYNNAVFFFASDLKIIYYNNY